MLSPSQERTQNDAVTEVFAYMRKHKLSMAELIEIGGQDLRSKNPGRAGKARAVSRCWELIAQLHLDYAALERCCHENFPSQPSQHTTPTQPRQRHRKSNPKGQANQQLDHSAAAVGNPNEINDLANSAPVGDPEPKLKRVHQSRATGNTRN